MTNCLEGIFAFLKIPFIPKGKRVVSEGKIYICIYIHTRARTQTHTRTKTNIFFSSIKCKCYKSAFLLRVHEAGSFFSHGGFGKGVFWCCCSRSCCKGVPSPPDHLPTPRSHQLLLQISSCSLQGMLISSRQGREKPQGWIKDEARRATRTSAPSRDRLALE